MQIDRESVTAELISAAVIQDDGGGLFLSAGLASEVIDAVLAIAQRAAEQEREACAKVAEQSARINAAICGLEVQDSIASRIRARTND